jgi:hypothetical protein
MITKNQLLEIIQTLPDEVTADDVIEKIILLQKIDKRIQQSNEGQIVSHQEAKSKLAKWYK